MGKNKLAKFAEMAGFENVIQISRTIFSESGYYLKGKWREQFFSNDHPIILELGCGKGEYSVGLAGRFPESNYIGIDIKGARMHAGAKHALNSGLKNVAFIRTHIENIESFFGRGETDEIWLTFPDPQMKKISKRLTSTGFISRFCNILKPGGVIHLKTDSQFLYSYTREMAKLNGFGIVSDISDVHGSGLKNDVLDIITFYEKQWIERGIAIKYLSFKPEVRTNWIEPKQDFEKDPYRSFGRCARP
jgi:tRNA (guanine-N7-)-methyltransferase